MGARLDEGPLDRERAVERYLRLQPSIRARIEASVPPSIREEFGAVTSHQLEALDLLADGRLSMRDLAGRLGVMGATATVLADRLLAQGLAVRLHDPLDRRVVRLELTPNGRRLSRLHTEARRRAAEGLFGRLSDQQVEAWLDVLETLAAEDEPDEALREAR